MIFVAKRWLNRGCVQAFSINKSLANDVTHCTSSFNGAIADDHSDYNQPHCAANAAQLLGFDDQSFDARVNLENNTDIRDLSQTS